jgi:hypothetical protein
MACCTVLVCHNAGPVYLELCISLAVAGWSAYSKHSLAYEDIDRPDARDLRNEDTMLEPSKESFIFATQEKRSFSRAWG